MTSSASVVVFAAAAECVFDALAALTDDAARTAAATDARYYNDHCDHDQNRHEKVPPFSTAKHNNTHNNKKIINK